MKKEKEEIIFALFKSITDKKEVKIKTKEKEKSQKNERV